MFKKGIMRPLKFIVGILLAVYTITYFIPIPLITDILAKIPYLHQIVMGIAAYFLIVTGRQL